MNVSYGRQDEGYFEILNALGTIVFAVSSSAKVNSNKGSRAIFWFRFYSKSKIVAIGVKVFQ
jgi:hypothetical protein